MRNPKIKSDIEKDLDVSLAIVPNAPEIKWVNDSVFKILDEQDFNPDGIEVVTNKGYIGHVKKIHESPDSIDDIKKRIFKKENQVVEFKETYHFDVANNKQDKDRTHDILKAVNSFLNADGGHLYIGVHDDGTLMGLKRDYSCMHEGNQNNDAFERQIRDLFKKNFMDYSTVHECTKKITFPIVDDIEICEITVKPSPKPILIKSKQITICEKKNNKQTQRLVDLMYRRNGNGALHIETMYEFLEYYLAHFVKTPKLLNELIANEI